MNAITRTGADALTVSVIRAKLKAIVEEVVEVMARTAFSPLLNQSRDFSTAIIDGQGRLLSQAERVPIHMGALPFAVAAVQERFGTDITEGDVFLLNDPYFGGSHLPDFTLCLPVFAEGQVRFWVVNRAHQGDIGGISPGGYSPEATQIWHEGLRLPPVKMVEGGKLAEAVLDIICLNSRMSDDTRGDVLAQLASVRVGAERLAALCARYGIARTEACCEAILDAGERAMRAQLRAWADGVYEGESWLDPPKLGAQPVRIHARVTIKGDTAEIDLSQSDDQLPNFLNSSLPNTIASVNVAFMYLSESQEAQNEGSSRPLTIVTRLGSVVEPKAPAPVTACTTLTASVVIEAIMKALEAAAPGQVLCGFARRFRFAIAGEDRNGRRFLWHYFSNRGGAGAHAVCDGWSNLGVVHSPGGNTAPSVERTESVFPFTIEAYHLRPNSAGDGMHRGGLGGVYALRYEGTAPALMTPTGDGVDVPPYGLAGGKPGLGNQVLLEQGGQMAPLQSKAGTQMLQPGGRLVCLSAGGGGYGDPARRDPALRERDRRRGYTD
ncbi:hydantoinase B/oxoprolinase family protein [Acetobacteraceae bacterium H6797]|nr:hydantoinase B/oxoprolinase family protein [Acetobacteraceae bacterium H6797]